MYGSLLGKFGLYKVVSEAILDHLQLNLTLMTPFL